MKMVGVDPEKFADVIAASINAAASEAQQAVLEFAAQFKKRSEYAPLELLASEVQRRAADAAAAVWREQQ